MSDNTRQIAIPELAVKLMGLVLIAISLPRLPFLLFSLIGTLQSAVPDTACLVGIQQGVPAICDLVVGIVLLCAGRAIASRFIVKEQVEVMPVTADTLASTLYSAVGLLIAMWAIPIMAANLADKVFMAIVGGHSSGDLYRNCMLIGSSLQFIGGIALFLGARGLVGLRARLRQAGMKNGL